MAHCNFYRAGRLWACFADCMADAAALHRQLNASLPQYIENHIATGAFLVGTLHRQDIKLDNGRDLGDFFVSLSVPDT